MEKIEVEIQGEKKPEQEVQQPEENILLKPKAKRKPYNLTDEQRKQKAEHMRKISSERIERLRLQAERRVEEEEKRAKEKLERTLQKIDVKKKNIKKIKDEKGIHEPEPEPKPEPPVEIIPSKPKKQEKKPKKKYVQVVSSEDESSSEDSNDYYQNEGSTDSESSVSVEYIYKKTPKQKSKTILKPKREKVQKYEAKPKSEQEPSRTIIKFI